MKCIHYEYEPSPIGLIGGCGLKQFGGLHHITCNGHGNCPYYKTGEEEMNDKEFWEWCGFRHIPSKYCDKCKRTEGEYWLHGKFGRRIYRPELLEGCNSLDFLFKYAVPKLRLPDLEFYLQDGRWTVKLYMSDSSFTDKDPAQALYKAIKSVMEGER